MKTIKKYTRRLIAGGTYSFVHSCSAHTVTYVTSCKSKIALFDYLEIKLGSVTEVNVDYRPYGRLEQGYYAVEVKKLTRPNPYQIDKYEKEVQRLRPYTTGTLNRLATVKINEFPILRPAISFVLDWYPRTTSCDADMDDRNLMMDDGAFMPIDVFNLDSMDMQR